MNEPSLQPSNHKTLKTVGALLAVAFVLAVLFLVPLTSKAPVGGPEVHLPSMQNIPEGTSLQLDAPPNH